MTIRNILDILSAVAVAGVHCLLCGRGCPADEGLPQAVG